MMRWGVLFGVACALIAVGALADTSPPQSPSGLSVAETPSLHFGPPPSWVRRVEPTIGPVPTQGGATQVLLRDTQVRLGPDGDEVYIHSDARVLSQQGLAQLGTFTVTWDPYVGNLTLHGVAVLRDGARIDVLNGGASLTVLRRERNLERAVLDGTLSATEQIPGLRVGDVVDLEMTAKRHDPVLGGRSQVTVTAPFVANSGADRWRLRLTWPDSKQIKWRVTEGLAAPSVVHASGVTELTEDLIDAQPSPSEPNLPLRYIYDHRLEATQFASWAEVSQLMAPLFAKAEVLAPDSAVRAEAAKIKAAASTPEDRVRMALALVQSQVRYEAITLGEGGYVPAGADDTWTRRYGDCKAKTALLMALLGELGVEAEPVLVHATLGDGLDQQLPQLTAFNHVLVRAMVNGHWYWLDGTRSGDPKALSAIAIPPFRWGLPVRNSGAELLAIDEPAPAAPLTELNSRIDVTAGVDAPAKTHSELIERGDLGLRVSAAIGLLSHEQAVQVFQSQFAKITPNFELTSLDWTWDPAALVFTIRTDGVAKLPWRWNSDVARYEYRLGAAPTVQVASAPRRSPGPLQDAPYAVPFPYFNVVHYTVVLPGNGAGFAITGSDIDRTVGAMQFTRKVRLAGGKVLFDASSRSLAREFPASEAATVAAFPEMLENDPVRLRAPPGLAPPAGLTPMPAAP
jgi:transglutaminase-like putative cysteine protease